MTRRKTSRARLRPFRIEDAPDLCRIYAMFFVDNSIHIGSGRLTVADVGGRAIGFVLWAPAFEPAWFDPGVDRWAELLELHAHPTFHNRGIGTRLVRAAIRQARTAGYPAMYLLTEESTVLLGERTKREAFESTAVSSDTNDDSRPQTGLSEDLYR